MINFTKKLIFFKDFIKIFGELVLQNTSLYICSK